MTGEEISVITKIRQDDVYEALASLGSKGMVKCLFSNPKTFEVESLSSIVDQITLSQNAVFSQIRKKTDYYQGLISQIAQNNCVLTASSEVIPSEGKSAMFRMLKGKEMISNTILRVTENTPTEIILTVTREIFSILGHRALFGLLEFCAQKGVLVKVIVPTESILSYLKKLNSKMLQIKLHETPEENSASFMIVDNTHTLVLPSSNVGSELFGLLSSNPAISQAFKCYFESRWNLYTAN